MSEEPTGDFDFINPPPKSRQVQKIITMTPLEIARAWWSVKDEWIVRRNKAHARKQWEVVHDWGDGLISEATMKIISRNETQEQAKRKAKRLEDAARGAAVLARL